MKRVKHGVFGEQFELDLTPVQQLVHVSERIEYDTNHGVAYLFMPRRFFCNMETAIELFTQLDPRVHTIETFVNKKPDTMYKKYLINGSPLLDKTMPMSALVPEIFFDVRFVLLQSVP
jgi:hypothetical protein